MSLPSAPFDAAKSIFAGLSIVQLKLDPALSTVTAEADDDVFTKAAHGLVSGQGVIFVSGTGFTGIVAGTTYYARDIASGTFKLAATVGGAAIDVTLDGTAGTFQPVLVFECGKLEHKDGREYKMIERPDSKGVLRPVRKVCVKGAEEFIYDLDEAKRLPTELFAGALSGLRDGTATVWEPDPSDASGKVALKSDTDFPCSVTREGGATFGGSDLTKSQIMIASKKSGDVLWTVDGNI